MVSSNLISHATRAALPTATSLPTSVHSAKGNLCTTGPPCIVPHTLAATLVAAAGTTRINSSDLVGSANLASKVPKTTLKLALPSID